MRPQEISCTPKESLILDLVTAYKRLGLQVTLIDSTHLRQLQKLSDEGLIGFDNGPIEKTKKVWLTEAGAVYTMEPDMVFPVLDPVCRKFYVGPKTNEFRVDCQKRNHHKGNHKNVTNNRKVRWDETETNGYASRLYGETLKQIDEESERKTREALKRFGKD